MLESIYDALVTIVEFIWGGVDGAIEGFNLVLNLLALPSWLVSGGLLPQVLVVGVPLFMGVYTIKFLMSLIP